MKRGSRSLIAALIVGLAAAAGAVAGLWLDRVIGISEEVGKAMAEDTTKWRLDREHRKQMEVAAGVSHVEFIRLERAVKSGDYYKKREAELSSLVVKGVYIGMDVQEAARQIRTRLPEDWGLSGPHKAAEGPGAYSVADKGFYVWIGGMLPMGAIIADDNGKVTTIRFSRLLVNQMFQAENMEASEFAQTFAKSYKIPSLEPKDSYDGWYYTSPEGYKVTISDGKDVFIEKTLSAKESQSTFD